MGVNETDLKWFAIRVTYSREMALKGYLDQYGIESFIPMHYKEFIKGEVRYSSLYKTNPEDADKLFAQAAEDAKDRLAFYQKCGELLGEII